MAVDCVRVLAGLTAYGIARARWIRDASICVYAFIGSLGREVVPARLRGSSGSWWRAEEWGRGLRGVADILFDDGGFFAGFQIVWGR